MSASIPKQMKALRIHEAGGPEVIKSEEAPVPTPGRGDVLIKTSWAGVNFIDNYFVSGLYPVKFPFTLGSEIGGQVVAVGEEVQDLKVGDEVGAYPGNGGYAEYCCTPRARVAKLPGHVDAKMAATVHLQALTAWGLLRESYPVQKGDTVLVHAAAGGVGIYLCQMAKNLGARVIGTTSTEEKAAFAKKNGADEVILYTKEDFAERTLALTDGKGVQAIYDGVGKTTWEGDFKCIARKGTIASFGNASGAVPEFSLMKTAQKNVKVTRPTLVNTVGTQEEMERYSAEVFGLLEKGILRPYVDGEYELSADSLRKAHEHAKGRGSRGKLLLKVA
ncbi:NAD(P)-binding protein [Jaminaea rosea]|uniref:Probable quinone oxidoreductase n=1 Tax=Jaminaea rosea TaxID=1569628 RepID=A0A316UNS5_9BASI|nr:NAD(P)-binding protein [Jaminaea rosea]PWN25563.1 NAD(P)-binding protein [Jaminaea rosea]